jgi:hypothetical protein
MKKKKKFVGEPNLFTVGTVTLLEPKILSVTIFSPVIRHYTLDIT